MTGTHYAREHVLGPDSIALSNRQLGSAFNRSHIGLSSDMVGTRNAPLAFQNAAELGGWLEVHHLAASELWVQVYKAGSGTPSVTWTDCVIEAIRFG